MPPSTSPKRKTRNREPTSTVNSLPRRILFVASLGFFWTFLCYRLAGYPVPWRTSEEREDSAAPVAVLQDEGIEVHEVPSSADKPLEDLLDIESLQSGTSDSDSSIPWLVGILPITENSLSRLESTLFVLLDAPGYLNEIVLLSPPELHQDIRHLLGRIFPEDFTPFLDLSISSWLNGLEEGAASLYAARQISADRFLFMDTTGLNAIDVDTRQMLLGTIATPLPVGPRGFNLTNIRQCITASDRPQPSAFLLPPFSVSSVLVPPHDLELSLVYDVWFSLGKHISRARFERVGGVAVASNSSAAGEWCSGKRTRPSLQEGLQEAPLVPEEQKDKNISHPETFDGKVHEEVDDKSSCRNENIIAAVFARLQDAAAFAPALCHLLAQHASVQTVILGDEKAGDDFLTRSLVVSRSCEIQYTVLNSSNTSSLVPWLSSLSCPPRLFIHSGLDNLIRQACSAAAYASAQDATLINIPSTELAYSDWVGSLTVQELRNWHKPQLDISIITNDRPESLSRLLDSLSRAQLFGDTVNLRINIEQTADVGTLDLVDNFLWTHGAKFVHRRVIHGGLLPAVVESWYPGSNNSYGLILEDDVELSPLFYAWVKMSLLHYRYGRPEDNSPDLFGVSLYQQKNLELRPEGRHRFNARSIFSTVGHPHPNTPFLSQIPCSWGAVYFPEHWREFHEYLAVRLSGRHPLLPIGSGGSGAAKHNTMSAAVVVTPGVRSNRWTHSWKKYFIELVFLRGYAMLYPNYAEYRSLSTNHLEVGSHVKVVPPEVYERKKRLFVLPLMEIPAMVAAVGGPNADESEGSEGVFIETGLLDLPEGRMPPWHALPITDLFGLLTTGEIAKERGSTRRTELFGCQSAPSTLSDVRELLCFTDTEDPGP